MFFNLFLKFLGPTYLALALQLSAGWGKRITSAQEFKISMGNIVRHPSQKKKIHTSFEILKIFVRG
jgi:hypothetical protein